MANASKREEKVKFIHLTQQLDPEFWDWATTDSERRTADGTMIDNRLGLSVDEARDLIEHAPAGEIGTYLVKRLEHVGDLFGVPGMEKEHPGAVVTAVYAIIHDRDEVEIWDDAQLAYVKVPKARHIHIIIVFEGDRRATYQSGTVDYLAKRIGVPANQIEKPKRGGNSPHVEAFGGTISMSLDNQLAYLVHIKYLEKFQYQPTDVATVRGPAYSAIYRERHADWIKGRAYVVKKRATENLEGLRAKALAGEVTREQIMLTDDLYEVWSRHQREVDDALAAYGQRRAYRAAADLKAGRYKTQIVFFAGASGSGKSWRAENYVDALLARVAKHGLHWGIYTAATNHPLDDWAGEEILFLDEARAVAMAAPDWLLLLDPHRASPAAARYKNKMRVAPRVIVITAPIDPWNYFFFVRMKGDVDEAMDQFIRRLSLLVTVIPGDDPDDHDGTRFRVEHMGRVTPYPHVLTIKESDGSSRVETLPMAFGPVDGVEHTGEGAIASLMLDVAERSRDVAFHEAKDWPALESVAADETAAFPAVLATRAAAHEGRMLDAASRLGDRYADHFRQAHLDGAGTLDPAAGMFICDGCVATTHLIAQRSQAS